MPESISITLSYAGQLAAEARVSEERLEIPEGTLVSQILRRVADAHGGKFHEMLFDEHTQLRRALVISIDGTQLPDPAQHPCEKPCELFIMTPIAGG